MITLKKIAVLLIAFFIGFGINSYISNNNSKDVKYVNSMLYDLNIEMDLLEHWFSTYNTDQVLEEKLKHLILNKILSLSIVKPDINSLQGVPQEALYRLIQFSKEKDISIKKYDASFKKALDYLSTIENGLKILIEERKNIHKKPLK